MKPGNRLFCFSALVLCLLLLLPLSAIAREEQAVYGVLTAPLDAEYVDLGEQVVDNWEAFYAFLEKLPALEKVDMFATIVQEKDIHRLVEKFPNIKFGWTIHFGKTHYIRTDQTAFSTLHGSCAPHTSKELDVLKYCTELLAFDIGHNEVTDISFLKNMPKLRVLILACNPDLRNISVLSELKDLEYLELFSCNIRDITPVVGLPRLMDLNIAYNQYISKYAGLEKMTHLKRLWIPQSGLPVSGKDFMALKNALPDTTVMSIGHPTAYGWREGNHYETIYSMFRLNEYVPFEDSWPLED